MKKWLLIMSLLVAVSSTFAQWGYHRYYRPRARVSIGIGAYVPLYPYYGYGPAYAFPPAYGYGYYYRPTELDLQIREIRSDYQHQIWLVKHDKSLSRKERRKQARELEHDRDKEIIQAQRDYYEKKTRRRHNFTR
jgi:hypothetical protein